VWNNINIRLNFIVRKEDKHIEQMTFQIKILRSCSYENGLHIFSPLKIVQYSLPTRTCLNKEEIISDPSICNKIEKIVCFTNGYRFKLKRKLWRPFMLLKFRPQQIRICMFLKTNDCSATPSTNCL